jgi:hypothetical protein
VHAIRRARKIGFTLWGPISRLTTARACRSVSGPAVLNAAGVPVALKSDHPVINAAELMYEAAKAASYGLPREVGTRAGICAPTALQEVTQAAIAAVTRVPATVSTRILSAHGLQLTAWSRTCQAIGMGAYIGSVETGKDGDLVDARARGNRGTPDRSTRVMQVIWDRDPLLLGAKPNKVIGEHGTAPELCVILIARIPIAVNGVVVASADPVSSPGALPPSSTPPAATLSVPQRDACAALCVPAAHTC